MCSLHNKPLVARHAAAEDLADTFGLPVPLVASTNPDLLEPAREALRRANIFTHEVLMTRNLIDGILMTAGRLPPTPVHADNGQDHGRGDMHAADAAEVALPAADAAAEAVQPEQLVCVEAANGGGAADPADSRGMCPPRPAQP